MTFNLEFLPGARKDWDKIDVALREQFKRKLRERLIAPRVPKDALRGMPDCYKMKAQGFRLAYRVIDKQLIVLVIAVGKREDSEVYEVAKRRLDDLD